MMRLLTCLFQCSLDVSQLDSPGSYWLEKLYLFSVALKWWWGRALFTHETKMSRIPKKWAFWERSDSCLFVSPS